MARHSAACRTRGSERRAELTVPNVGRTPTVPNVGLSRPCRTGVARLSRTSVGSLACSTRWCCGTRSSGLLQVRLVGCGPRSGGDPDVVDLHAEGELRVRGRVAAAGAADGEVEDE